MKYVAVCVLSVATMVSAAASPSAESRMAPTTSPAPLLAPVLLEPVAAGGTDSLLMLGLGGALIALQLRRRQKSLRTPRTLILAG